MSIVRRPLQAYRFVLTALLVLFAAGVLSRRAAALETAPVAPPAQTNFEFHNRDTGAPLPVQTMTNRTHIAGPVAVTDIAFVCENTNKQPIEAAVTFEVPRGTVLTKFGYYYNDRFIPGKMYDKGEAWKIYSAVTSRGRDPGIMDRPTETNYHAQIFPVAPNRSLRVHVTLVQTLQSDANGLRFELPLVQGQAYLNGWNREPFLVDARVTYSAGGEQHTKALKRRFTPRENLRVVVPMPGGVAAYSRMVGAREGYYAVTVRTPHALGEARLRLESNGLTSLSLPTSFGDLAGFEDIHVFGRYRKPGVVRLVLRGASGGRIVLPVTLSGARGASVQSNPAASLWANKRISVLQEATRRDFKPDIIRLSQRFMVVSNFTALLAIPKEELDYYRKVLAKQKIETNTRTTGGGGGDPYIAVHAPEDAAQVVALFPDGDVKNLAWNPERGVWDGRFDLAFGTPEGECRVTVIVVHRTGERTTFTLVYQNRMTGPRVDADTCNCQMFARAGGAEPHDRSPRGR